MSLDYPGGPRWKPRVFIRKRQAGQRPRKDEVATSQGVQELLEAGKGKRTSPLELPEGTPPSWHLDCG